MDRAVASLLMQWFAVKKYGRLPSLSVATRVPVQ
jgi:hypothetical protein